MEAEAAAAEGGGGVVGADAVEGGAVDSKGVRARTPE